MKPLIVLTTVGANHDAHDLGTDLVEKRLAACVNIIPRIDSIYQWRGNVEREQEQLLIIKTVDEQLDALKDAIFARHPYEVPEFIVVAMDDVGDAYREWLISSVRG
jgi:periplasmic divalent cation tolerance protein